MARLFCWFVRESRGVRRHRIRPDRVWPRAGDRRLACKLGLAMFRLHDGRRHFPLTPRVLRAPRLCVTTLFVPSAPTIVVFNSGLGGLTVFREVAKARPDARFVYVADDAFFPYGGHGEAALVARVVALMGALIASAPARSRRDRLQHRLDAGAAAPARALRGALRRHGAGDQAGLRGLADAARVGARHRGDGRARIHPRADPRIRQRLRRDARRLGAACGLCRSGAQRRAGRRMRRSRARSRPASSRRAARAPIRSCSPARIIRCCSTVCERLSPWPVSFIDPAPAIARRVVDLIGPAADQAAPPRTAAVRVHLRPGAFAAPCGPRFARFGLTGAGARFDLTPPFRLETARSRAFRAARRFATRGPGRRFGGDLSVAPALPTRLRGRSARGRQRRARSSSKANSKRGRDDQAPRGEVQDRPPHGPECLGPPEEPRQPPRIWPRPARPAPQGQALRLRRAAARQAEAARLLRQHLREAVPRHLPGSASR